MDEQPKSQSNLVGLEIASDRIADTHRNRNPELDLSKLGLISVPRSIAQLKTLQVLNLADNQLSALPAVIGELQELKSLNVSFNQLTTLPTDLRRCSQLQRLDLRQNQLGALPDFIGDLVGLKKLLVHGNKIAHLPDSIGKLEDLEILDLSNNDLSRLPESVGKLKRLGTLNLANNQLEELPDGLRDLTDLRILLVGQNKALGLPAEITGEETYCEFCGGRIQWDDIFCAHCGGRQPIRESEDTRLALPRDILEYYFRLREGRKPLNEAKLLLVGRGGVGKTSIVNRLVSNTFRDERKTPGIKITEWRVKIHEDENIRLNLWDFGGQEIMHATHQFFFTQRSLYLLVLNGREGGEDADAEYWLKLIESFGGDSPVIIVLNKTREHPFDLNRRALQQKYRVRDFIATDCEDGTGIDELRKTIERETDRLEDLRKAFPAGWFAIKDRLSEMKRNFLSFNEYRRICEEHGEYNDKAQEDLAGFLHRLGIALNYRDDPRLEDTHVLNPQWVTNGIYKVLNSERLQKQEGEIRLKDLAEILDESEYPASMRRFIFDLMKKFELCFSFPEDDTRYLVPELLDKQQPVEADIFQPELCLNFQYHYPVLPEGLLPRFIVRTHVLSEHLPRWRTGVILEFEGCQALVKADVQDKKVFIYLIGPAKNRRRLLAVIRSDFERIHRDIRNLQPLEMIPVPQYQNIVIPYEKLLAMERTGIGAFPEYTGGKVIQVNVTTLLGGVDLDEVRATKTRRAKGARVRLFISYSHKDDNFRMELENHLKILHRRGMVETWSDRRIDAGQDWRKDIDEKLERAEIVLLLVSSDFIASDYCYEIEMTRALERQTKGEAEVIPIIVRDVNWHKAPFAKLCGLPTDGNAVELWPNKDSAWRNVSEGIERVVENLSELRSDGRTQHPDHVRLK